MKAALVHNMLSPLFIVFDHSIDLRLPSSKAASQQRSINLAISHRGLAALEAIDAATVQKFMQDAIPMRGRMIHSQSGLLDSQLYDRDGQVISAIISFTVLYSHTLYPSFFCFLVYQFDRPVPS